MPTLLLAIWIMLKLLAVGAGIGGGIVLGAWLLRRAERLEIVTAPEGDMNRATRRMIDAQDRLRRAEGAQGGAA